MAEITTTARRCICGWHLEPVRITTSDGPDVMWRCPNQWADGDHRMQTSDSCPETP